MSNTKVIESKLHFPKSENIKQLCIVGKFLSSKNQKQKKKKDYIVLDDLTTNFKQPNIFDIKIGTRQHGDEVDPEKKIRHTNKVKTTTSKPLGLRISGIQVLFFFFFLSFFLDFWLF